MKKELATFLLLMASCTEVTALNPRFLSPANLQNTARRGGTNAGALAREEPTHDNMIRLMVGRHLDTAHQPAHAEGPPDSFGVDALRTQRYPQQAVSFGVARGEILGVAGLVGAGRSEVALAIAGIEPRVAGTITLDGATVAVADPADAIGHGVCPVLEDRRLAGLVVASSIRENVSLAALPRYSTCGPVSGARERESVGAMCRQLQVRAPSIEVATATLSGGNQQKVALAKWLLLGPRLLIVDEPTRGIDVGAKAEIYRLLRSLSAEGVSIVMISSDMEEVLLLSDRVAVMCEGRLTGVLERPDCTESRIMALATAA
jgi:ribose transport system ATP-binding protein